MTSRQQQKMEDSAGDTLCEVGPLANKPLRNQCKCLLVIHDKVDATIQEIQDETGLTYSQVTAALQGLRKQGKIKVKSVSPNRVVTYRPNDNYIPQPNTNKRGMYNVEPISKARPSYTGYTFAVNLRQKINAIKAAILKAGPDDKDYLMAIKADYERLIG